jgi:uncharacterized protein (DUF1501 family)
MILQRRTLLTGAALAAPAIIAGRAFAAPQAGSRLLVIFLRGAYDALNAVPPTAVDFYHDARPGIAIARPAPSNPASAVALEGPWGLHPALRDSLLPFWQKRQLAFVPFAGTDDMSRSHFATQDTIELGQPIGGSRDYRSGFMARLAGILGQAEKPIAFTDQMPLCFRDPSRLFPNLGLAHVGRPMNARYAKLIEGMYQDQSALAKSVAEGLVVQDVVFDSLEEEMQQASRGAVSTKGFELSARRIGTVMRDQFNLAFVDVGGWDTHVNQGGATGYLANRLGELGRGLAGFVEAIGPAAWQSTTLVVLSEFGRTFRENGGRGTDHGHGTIYWIMGGNIAGGRFAGEQVDLSPATLNQGRDLPVLTNYRALLGGLFARQYGLNSGHLAKVFADIVPKDLQLI